MQTQTCTFHLLKRISIPAHGRLGISQLLLGYNQQLSTSQIHKQSFVLLHWGVFFVFFHSQVSEKREKKDPDKEILFRPVLDFSLSLQSKCLEAGGDFERLRQEQLSGALDHLS